MSEKDNKHTGVKTNEIKAFEEKIFNKHTGGIQPELVFDIEIEKEINGIQMGVLKNGTPYLTQTGLAKLCGTTRFALYDIERDLHTDKQRAIKIRELLKAQGYNENSLFIKVHQEGNIVDYNAYPDSVCMALLEYFAFESKPRRPEAVDNYRLLAKTSFRMYIYGQVGYTPQTQRLNEWRHFLDRVDLNYDTVPQGYFSIFKEMAGLTVSLIKNNVIIDDRTIPDLSVGIVWGKMWLSNGLDSVYGERVKYIHNFPDYYPQSASNPQEPWAYPNEALAFFRKWFQNEYITNNFPKYLLTKVKQLALTPQDSKKVLEAVTPKNTIDNNKQATQNNGSRAKYRWSIVEDIKDTNPEIKQIMEYQDKIDKQQQNPTSAQFIKNIQADNPEIDANNKFESNIKKVIKYKKNV